MDTASSPMSGPMPAFPWPSMTPDFPTQPADDLGFGPADFFQDGNENEIMEYLIDSFGNSSLDAGPTSKSIAAMDGDPAPVSQSGLLPMPLPESLPPPSQHTVISAQQQHRPLPTPPPPQQHQQHMLAAIAVGSSVVDTMASVPASQPDVAGSQLTAPVHSDAVYAMQPQPQHQPVPQTAFQHAAGTAFAGHSGTQQRLMQPSGHGGCLDGSECNRSYISSVPNGHLECHTYGAADGFGISSTGLSGGISTATSAFPNAAGASLALLNGAASGNPGAYSNLAANGFAAPFNSIGATALSHAIAGSSSHMNRDNADGGHVSGAPSSFAGTSAAAHSKGGCGCSLCEFVSNNGGVGSYTSAGAGHYPGGHITGSAAGGYGHAQGRVIGDLSAHSDGAWAGNTFGTGPNVSGSGFGAQVSNTAGIAAGTCAVSAYPSISINCHGAHQWSNAGGCLIDGTLGGGDAACVLTSSCTTRPNTAPASSSRMPDRSMPQRTRQQPQGGMLSPGAGPSSGALDQPPSSSAEAVSTRPGGAGSHLGAAHHLGVSANTLAKQRQRERDRNELSQLKAEISIREQDLGWEKKKLEELEEAKACLLTQLLPLHRTSQVHMQQSAGNEAGLAWLKNAGEAGLQVLARRSPRLQTGAAQPLGRMTAQHDAHEQLGQGLPDWSAVVQDGGELRSDHDGREVIASLLQDVARLKATQPDAWRHAAAALELPAAKCAPHLLAGLQLSEAQRKLLQAEMARRSEAKRLLAWRRQQIKELLLEAAAAATTTAGQIKLHKKAAKATRQLEFCELWAADANHRFLAVFVLGCGSQQTPPMNGCLHPLQAAAVLVGTASYCNVLHG